VRSASSVEVNGPTTDTVPLKEVRLLSLVPVILSSKLYLNQELQYTLMNNAQKSILLTGATGNIGTKVVKLLFTIPDGNVTVRQQFEV
jgi:hypothetical protein